MILTIRVILIDALIQDTSPVRDDDKMPAFQIGRPQNAFGPSRMDHLLSSTCVDIPLFSTIDPFDEFDESCLPCGQIEPTVAQ